MYQAKNLSINPGWCNMWLLDDKLPPPPFLRWDLWLRWSPSCPLGGAMTSVQIEFPDWSTFTSCYPASAVTPTRSTPSWKSYAAAQPGRSPTRAEALRVGFRVQTRRSLNKDEDSLFWLEISSNQRFSSTNIWYFMVKLKKHKNNER